MKDKGKKCEVIKLKENPMDNYSEGFVIILFTEGRRTEQ